MEQKYRVTLTSEEIRVLREALILRASNCEEHADRTELSDVKLSILSTNRELADRVRERARFARVLESKLSKKAGY